MGHLTIVRDEEPAGGLTDRQRQVLDFISDSIRKRGYPPTLREIGSHFGIRSTNGVNDHLRALEKKGFLHREDLKSRALRPLFTEDDFVEVPVLGKVAAGQPMLAVQNYEDYGQGRPLLHRPEPRGLRPAGQGRFHDRGRHFRRRLRVHSQAATGLAGEIVVAMIGDEATVKRYYPEGDNIRFQPANATMSPIIVRKRDFRSVNLLGVVIGVYRKMM